MKTISFTQRNPAIDILRALVMVLMVFVNDLWHVAYPHWMGHAALEEDMLGLSDIVFPCFLFAVGMSIPYALENAFNKGRTGVQVAAHILTRSLALLIMGVFLVNTEGGISPDLGINRTVFSLLLVGGFFLVWNVYPKTEKSYKKILYKVLRWAGIVLLAVLAIIFVDKSGQSLRPKWWGILGLIGWTYLVCAFVYYFTRDRLKYLIPIFLIFLVWNMLKCRLASTGVPILNLPAGNALDAFVNVFQIGNGAHCALTMAGIILSVAHIKCMKFKAPSVMMIAIGAVVLLCVAGWLTNRFWIISKLQATAPWVLYSCAISVAAYATLVWICRRGGEKMFLPVKPAGTATLTCYMAPHILYATFTLTGIGTARPEWLGHGIQGILSCLAFSFLCVGLTWLLGKANIKLKV